MTTAQTHQPVAYQIEDANGEFMCLSRTKSTVRGVTSKPLYDESALEKERTARMEAQQRLADMQELAAKAGLAHMKAVQRSMHEAMADERAACALVCRNLQPPESCTGVEKSLLDVATMACAEAVGKMGAP